jgi:hypothetical protein
LIRWAQVKLQCRAGVLPSSAATAGCGSSDFAAFRRIPRDVFEEIDGHFLFSNA